jgi:hypothetical protein
MKEGFKMLYKLTYLNNNGERIDFTLSGGIVISNKSGFTENSVDVPLSQGFNQIGGTKQGQSVQPKIVAINGELVRDAQQKRKRMLECIAPRIPAKLIYNDEWVLDVVPTATPTIEAGTENAKFQFRLRAAYPYWQSVSDKTTHIAGLEPLFMFPWNISNPNPFKMSEKIDSLFGNVYNGGNVEIPFTVMFRATSANVTNPALIKVKTHEFIKINRVMDVGEIIVVENTSESITVTSSKFGVIDDIFAWTDIDSTFFLLDRGDNLLKYDADENVENLDIRVLARDAIVGVW